MRKEFNLALLKTPSPSCKATHLPVLIKHQQVDVVGSHGVVENIQPVALLRFEHGGLWFIIASVRLPQISSSQPGNLDALSSKVSMAVQPLR